MIAVEAAIATASIKILSSQLHKFVVAELKQLKDADNKFRDLGRNLSFADDTLQKMGSSYYLQENEAAALQLQVKILNRVYYDVDDFMNDMQLQIERKNAESMHRKPVRHALRWSWNKWMQAAKMDEMLKEITALNEGLKRLHDSNLNLNNKGTEVICDFDPLESKGREESTALSIIEELINGNQTLNGVSIVGIRGLGKRALAKHVINCKEVKAKFSLILKASFSGNTFNMNAIALEVLYNKNQVKERKKDDDDNVDIKILINQDNWLLWIDQVSNMPRLAWNHFQNSYLGKDGKRIRKVVITTLNPVVAKETQTSMCYLEALSDKCCEELISLKASSRNQLLSENRRSCSVSSNVIQNVAKKCYGLPLVAIWMALGLSKGEGEDYQEIVNKELWDMSKFRQELLPYLHSSFGNLKPAIMKCFCYLSLFPQNHVFSKEELILQWIGLGLVMARQENGHFNGLLENSILQPLPMSNTDFHRYYMNKFSHSYAQFAAPKIYVRLGGNINQDDLLLEDINICHLSLTHDIQKSVWDKIKTRKCLRTLLALYYGHNPGRLKEIPVDLFSRLTHLRVLVLKNTDVDKLPNSIISLKRLRLLDVSETPITRLPNSLCDLRDTLQILKFKKRRDTTVQLPMNFSDLINLVFVDWEVHDINNLLSKPKNIGKLINLETLPLYEVGNIEGYHITELEHMNNLRESLRITKLEEVPSKAEAKKAVINMKSFLERLELVWTNNPQNIEVAKKVLSGLKPHTKLRELQIVNYGCNSLPKWLGHPSLSLQKLHLKDCSNCTYLPSFSQVPALEVIHLQAMHNLTTLPSLSCLSSLVELKIKDCEALSCLPDLPQCLKSLIINGSPSLTSWCQPQGRNWYVISHVETIEIDYELFKIPANEIPQQESSFQLQDLKSKGTAFASMLGTLLSKAYSNRF